MIGLFGLAVVLLSIYFVVNRMYKGTEYYHATKVSLVSLWFDKGKLGECLIYDKLRYLPGYKKFLFNCYIPREEDKTTEIDVILLHESGIYVFESKNYSGWIFGSENQKQWTQSLKSGRGRSRKEHFLNPIIQNKVHLKWLQSYLKNYEETQFFSYIVFSERCTLKAVTLTSENHRVIKRDEVLDSVSKQMKMSERKLSMEIIDKIYEILYPLTQVSEKQKAEHINDIKKSYVASTADSRENAIAKREKKEITGSNNNETPEEKTDSLNKEIVAMMKVSLYTDGSARGNPDGPGGYGAILQYTDPSGKLHEREYSAGYVKTTNNRMELMAVIAGLEALNRPCEVEVFSDSAYVIKAFTEHWLDNWQKKNWMRGKNDPVKNVDLWKRLLNAKEPHDVTFIWVKGHDGHPQNERCDVLATTAADGEDLIDDVMIE
jgi:ribonuclease HI